MIYAEHGFDSRKSYLISLAEDFSLPVRVVLTIASVLGASEDFDGLITELEDLSWSSEFEGFE